MVDAGVLEAHPAALSVWSYVTAPETKRMDRESIRQALGISERQWRYASKALREMGLMTVTTIKDVAHRCFWKKIQFHADKPHAPANFSGCTDIVSGGDARGGCKGEPMTPELARKHTDRFLNRFPGKKTFQTFDDKKGPDGKGRGRLAKIIHDDETYLKNINDQGAGVFLTINETDGKGRETRNITKVRAIYVDLDGADVNPVLQEMPHMVVESSPGKFHGYWLVKDFPLEAFKATQQRLIKEFGGDKAVCDLPRVMRVPGYVHHKGEPFTTQIVFEHHGEPLTYAEVCEKFPPEPVKPWSAPKYQQKQEDGEYTGPYGCGRGERNNRLARFLGGMVKRCYDRGKIEHEAMKWGKSCSPPMETGEINSVVRSICRYLGC